VVAQIRAIQSLKRTWFAAAFFGAGVIPLASFLSLFFDEVYDGDGKVRAHYRRLIDRLGGFSSAELARREQIRDELFRMQGITFTVYGDEAGIERTFPMDLLPRVIPADEWETIELFSAGNKDLRSVSRVCFGIC
jgi:hypothetical protein